MRIFSLTATPIPIVANATDRQNVRDIFITNTGTQPATLQFDNDPVGTSALGVDVNISPGVGYILAGGASLPLVGGRPGSRLGSMSVWACSASATTLAVQIITGTNTLP